MLQSLQSVAFHALPDGQGALGVAGGAVRPRLAGEEHRWWMLVALRLPDWAGSSRRTRARARRPVGRSGLKGYLLPVAQRVCISQCEL